MRADIELKNLGIGDCFGIQFSGNPATDYYMIIDKTFIPGKALWFDLLGTTGEEHSMVADTKIDVNISMETFDAMSNAFQATQRECPDAF